MPHPFTGGKARLAYVEFGDEESMKSGLEKHAEVCLIHLIYRYSLLTFFSCRH